ncbi:MAG TPA: histidine kinase [Anaerolineales bacterium]|nr:histidine kinase [Anaerolineales bacterium]
MSERTSSAAAPLRPGRIGVTAIYLAFVAETARTLVLTTNRDLWPWYLGLHSVFIISFTAVLWRPALHAGLLHVYFALQSAIILGLLSLNPQLDFVTALFVLLCYQAALVFAGWTRWLWIGLFVLLIGGSLMFYLGPLRGLALALTSMASGIVFPAYVIANHESEAARAASQAMLNELEATHRQLEAYAGQVEELAAMEERNRLARELHDSVSQTMFSIALNTRSAQILLERDPVRVRPQLEQLQELTQNALAQMRSLIAELRPKTG